MPPKSTSGYQKMKSKLELREAELEEVHIAKCSLEHDLDNLKRQFNTLLIENGEKDQKLNAMYKESKRNISEVRKEYRNTVHSSLTCKYCSREFEQYSRVNLWAHYRTCDEKNWKIKKWF